MSDTFTTKLPQSTTEMQLALRAGIESFIKSPVNNQNKLNDSLAISLGLPNYNALKPRLNEVHPIEAHITDLSHDNKVVINGLEIHDDVFSQEMTRYKLVPREDEIDWITDFIINGTVTGENKTLAIADVKSLLSLSDEYVLKHTNFNRYLSPTKDTVNFNEECNEILVASGHKLVSFKVTQDKTNNEKLANLITTSPVVIKKSNLFITSSYINNKTLVLCHFDKDDSYCEYEFNIYQDTFIRNGNGSFTLKKENHDDFTIVLLSPMNI